MVTKEIYDYIEQNKVKELYKKFVRYFEWIDKWSDEKISGDLLDENELSQMIDRGTAIFAKLCPVVNALESYLERKLNNVAYEYYKSLEKVKSVDADIAKFKSRDAVSDVRDYLADFKGYFIASQQIICSAQSRLKRLSVEKGARGVGYTGEVPVEQDEPEGWVE